MQKERIETNTFIPMPVALVGAHVGGKANFMAVGFITRVNANPPYLALGIGKHHHTPKGIIENGTFSVNFPHSGMVEATDYCGIVSGRSHDKSSLFKTFYGDLDTAPMIEECPLTLECRLVETHEMPTNYMFIGEIIGAYADESRFTEGRLDFRKVDPLMLTMRDNNYWKLGEKAGDAWSAGKALRDKLDQKKE